MSDTPAEPTRDTESGRYVRRHSADGKADSGGDNADSAGDNAAEPPADSGETTDVPPPPPPTEGGDDDKDDKNGKKRWLLLLLLLLILLLLVCAGFAYNKWWGKKEPDPVATATPTAAATATARPTPTPSVTASATASPTPSPTATVKTINMPNVVGMPAADAKVILEGAGFTNIKFINESKDGEELKVLVSFTVSKQSATAGTAIPADTALAITCKTTSNGKG